MLVTEVVSGYLLNIYFGNNFFHFTQLINSACKNTYWMLIGPQDSDGRSEAKSGRSSRRSCRNWKNRDDQRSGQSARQTGAHYNFTTYSYYFSLSTDYVRFDVHFIVRKWQMCECVFSVWCSTVPMVWTTKRWVNFSRVWHSLGRGHVLMSSTGLRLVIQVKLHKWVVM